MTTSTNRSGRRFVRGLMGPLDAALAEVPPGRGAVPIHGGRRQPASNIDTI